MRMHKQSANRLNVNEQGVVLGWIPRRQHYAVEAACSVCGAKEGSPCIVNGRAIGLLEVHHVRAMAVA